MTAFSWMEIQIIFLVIMAGMMYYVNEAWKKKGDTNRIRSFFLADGKLGAERTENNTLGMTFAWSGGTWFYVIGAFMYGPVILLVQPAWCISLVVLGLLFSKIHQVTKNRTIHGFLDAAYGKKVRKIASFATTFGYIFNTGFEIFWSSLLFGHVLGHPELSIIIAIFIATLIAVYCSIGGFTANASTDKPQNILGVLALAVLSMIVVVKSGSMILMVAGVIFSIGAGLYIFFSLLTNRISAQRQMLFRKMVSGFAIGLAAIAIFLSVFLSTDAGGINQYKGLLPISPTFFIGMVAFMVVFNIVDMANWQSIAANGEIKIDKHGPLKWSLIRSGLYVNWFPSLGGILLGLGLRLLYSDLTDKNIFQFAFAEVLPGADVFIRGIVLGILILGFLSTTLSTADSYLMSAVQTLMYDILYHDEIKELLANEDPQKEAKIVKKLSLCCSPLQF